MKKTINTLLVIFMIMLVLTGCGKKDDTSKSVAMTLADSFVETIKNEKDLQVVAQQLSKNEIIQTKMMVEEKSDTNFLNGFDKEIKEYEKAYVMQPMINSIPFIMYVFETNNASALEKELKENANPRWNICVEADDTVIKTVDNYVFFVMAPTNFEE